MPDTYIYAFLKDKRIIIYTNMSVKDAKAELLKLITSYGKKGKPLWRNEIDRQLHLNPTTFKKAVKELEEEGKIKTEVGVIEEEIVVKRKRRALLFKSNNK